MFVNGVEQTEGFIIDWPLGFAAERPEGLPRFEVSFYVRSPSQPSYVVLYETDSSTGRGYVYLPGKGDQWYEQNTFAIFHGRGLEGHWFRAMRAWQNIIQPLVAVR